jgi:hypothetical protein
MNGLPYVPLRPYTDAEWDIPPQVIWTSDAVWDPTVLDHKVDNDPDWFDAISELESNPFHNLFDEHGNYHKRVLVQTAETGTVDCFDTFTPTFFDALTELRSDDVYDMLDSVVYDTHLTCLHVQHTNTASAGSQIHQEASPGL